MTTLESVLSLHELQYRSDGQGWIVGRPATGEFVELPAAAKTILDLLGAGATIAEAKRAADAQHGEDLDVLEFVEVLVELGFVASIAGLALDQQARRPPSLRFLRPWHVAFIFTRPFAYAAAAFTVLGLVVGATRHVLPGYRAFFALPEPGLNALIGLCLICGAVALHEFWHLAAARSADVNAWVGWSTRLAFLVAQTRVPGLWGVDRRIRIRVFLAGMAGDAVLISACLLASADTAPASLPHRLAQMLCLSVMFSVFGQCSIFMRTDLYLVIQELTGCKNLYADAASHLRWRWRERTSRTDPVDELPVGERRTVRRYSMVMAAGTVAALGLFCCYQVPILVATIVRAIEEMTGAARHHDSPRVVDGLTVLLTVVGLQAFTIHTLLRRRH